jgi:hypothetical protein
MKREIICYNCGVPLPETEGPPDHAYAVLVENPDDPDNLEESFVAIFCDECGENLGLRRIDLVKARREQEQ